MYEEDKPLISSQQKLPEITIKAVIIAIVLTIILTASNAYLALKIGTTVAASIPAAILAMGILRFFKQKNVLEINIIQTAASAGEAVVGAISFSIPALVMMHYWQNFHYWEIVLITTFGGILGVLFSVPLRRVLLADKNLLFPEGTAIGNVLRATNSSKQGVGFLIKGGIFGAILEFFQTGLHVVSAQVDFWWSKAGTIFGFGSAFSPALIAAGYIVGLRVAIALLFGITCTWFVGMPILSHLVIVPTGLNASDSAGWIWLHELRYIGVGTMLVGGVWLLLTLLKPLAIGIRKSFAAITEAKVIGYENIERVERDLPIHYALGLATVLMLPIYAYLYYSFQANLLNISLSTHILICLILIGFVFVLAFLVSSICGYFAGLIGSTNSPLSGMILITLILGAFLIMLIFAGHYASARQLMHLAAMTVIIAAIVGSAGAISVDTIQDLKAGHMVGATPWKQQVMLMLGVVVSALVAPLILNLLFNAYGIGDVFPRPGMVQAQVLSAPQGQLIQSVVMGVFGGDLNWPMVHVGMVFAVVCVIIDEFLKFRKLGALPVLAVGIGIYLPIEITLPMILGGLVAGILDRRYKLWTSSGKKEQAQANHERSILLACGLVAGSTLTGVVLAVPFVIYQSSDALAIMPAHLLGLANVLGILSLVALCAWLYRTGSKQH